MKIGRWVYGKHVELRMRQRNVTPADVLTLLDDPANKPYVSPATGHHSFFGQTADGRDLEIVVDPVDFFIVTVIA